MADIRTFQASHIDLDIEVTLAIDFDILTEVRATEINAFWTSADERLFLCEDDIRLAVARHAAQFFIVEIVERFNPPVTTLNQAIEEAEGWGGYAYNGIKLIDYAGGISVEFEDIECIEVEAEVANG